MRSGSWEAIRAITKHPQLARQIATYKKFCAVITATLPEDVALWKESMKDTPLDSAAPMKPYNLLEIRQSSAIAAALRIIANMLNAGKPHWSSTRDDNGHTSLIMILPCLLKCTSVYILYYSSTGRVVSKGSGDDDDLNSNIVTALTASGSEILNKVMLEMPWLLSYSRNRIIAGSVRQMPIPDILFHAYKVYT
jgi:hypothetical protein